MLTLQIRYGLVLVFMLGCKEAHAEWQDPCAQQRAELQAFIDRNPNASPPRGSPMSLEYDRLSAAIRICFEAPARARAAAEKAEDERQSRQLAESHRKAEELADKVQADPTSPRLAWSAFLCGWNDDYNEAIHEIAEYRKAAKLGGVLDLGAVNDWQEEAMRAQRHRSDARAALKQLKTKPQPCKDPVVAKIAYCMTDETRGPEECDEAQPYWKIARSNE